MWVIACLHTLWPRLLRPLFLNSGKIDRHSPLFAGGFRVAQFVRIDREPNH